MASLTLSMSEELKAEVKHLNWVNWSEIAREEALKFIDNSIKLSPDAKDEIDAFLKTLP